MSRGADITGHKKGEWEVIRQEGKDKNGTNTWLIRCSCGTELHVTRAKWNAKLSNRCKHHKASLILQTQGKSLTDTKGARFGELTIIDEKPYIRVEHQRVNVRCECGEVEEMKLCDLVQGRRTCCSKCAAIRGQALRKKVRITWDRPKKVEPLHIAEETARKKGLSYGQMQALEYRKGLEKMKKEKFVFDKTVETSQKTIVSCNSIEVEVGTTGYQGGDYGHGARTYIRIQDVGSTAIKTNVTFNEDKKTNGVEIFLGGDSELDTIIKSLEYAAKKLQEEAQRK